MKTLHLAIITVIGIGAVASLGIVILSTPHPAERFRIASPQHYDFGGIAVNQVTGKEYVCNDLGFVNVLDARTGRTLGMIPMGGIPQDIAVNPVTDKIYAVIGSYPRPRADSAVDVIDGTNDTIVKEISLAEMGKKPPEMIFNAMQGGKTYKIWPVQVAVNPRTDRIYVSDWNYGDGGVTVIDGRTDKVVNAITGLDGGSYGIGVDPETGRIYVDNVQYGYKAPYQVTVIDGYTGKILANVTIGLRGPHGVSTIPGPAVSPLAVNPSTNMVYASCSGCMAPGQNQSRSWISVINGTTDTVANTIPLDALDIAVNPKINTLYSTLGSDPVDRTAGSFRVAIIDGQTNHVTDYLQAGRVGSSVAVDQENGNVYVTGNYLGKGGISVFGSNALN
ncbi:MAG: hypothetical protein KGI33_11640 [Thaumarchaeota archaeon]|nr:hypothetical protein [Nitrososphaerota archaeon]